MLSTMESRPAIEPRIRLDLKLHGKPDSPDSARRQFIFGQLCNRRQAMLSIQGISSRRQNHKDIIVASLPTFHSHHHSLLLSLRLPLLRHRHRRRMPRMILDMLEKSCLARERRLTGSTLVLKIRLFDCCSLCCTLCPLLSCFAELWLRCMVR
jgi:hypothetical protein